MNNNRVTIENLMPEKKRGNLFHLGHWQPRWWCVFATPVDI